MLVTFSYIILSFSLGAGLYTFFRDRKKNLHKRMLFFLTLAVTLLFIMLKVG